jgi:4a-hydroxytetrahydrobiopterin dehydratase
MGEGPEEDRDDELAPRPILGGGLEVTHGGALAGHGHGVRSIVDTGEMADPDGWSEVSDALERTFELPSFRHALDFVNRVGELAEREDHHPDIAIHYKEVTLRWWTHTAGGVTDRDRELARKTNALG